MRTRVLACVLTLLLLAQPALPTASGAAAQAPGAAPLAVSRDLMSLTDEPGSWFKSRATGKPVTFVRRGGQVKFDVGELTTTRHTITLLSKPPASTLEVDQAEPLRGGGVEATFDQPGVYLFVCKVHPYMAGVVGVTNSRGIVPDVTKEQLPFIGHLGLDALPASAVIGVLTNLAPTDADKRAKWDLFGPADGFSPAVPGVGEVWVNTQFEAVAGQTDSRGVPKPGTITVLDAASFTVEREVTGLDPEARFRWNNPHNLWADASLSVLYNGNWFGQWLNLIDRASGDIISTTTVGEAPTHIVTNPNEASGQFELLTCPLSAADEIHKLEDRGHRELKIVDSHLTGAKPNHPHGQWVTADGAKIVVPNVFKGIGLGGSIAIMDFESGNVLREIRSAPSGLEAALLLPVAAGIKGNSKAYVSNIGSGQVSVVDLATQRLVKNIPVTFTPAGQQGPQFSLFDTLQAPIQAPVSPDGRLVGVAVLSLTTVDRAPTGAADHVALIDTATDTAVAFLPAPAGAHGANWGAKLGGGSYLYVTSQHANALTVIDPDPNGDGSAADAAVVGRIILANGSSGLTDGTGGQGTKPLPNVYDGWVQDTVALSGSGRLSAEVEGWVRSLTACQRDPAHCAAR